MGVFDSIKGIFNIPDEDDYDEELEQTAEKEEPKKSFQYSEQTQKNEKAKIMYLHSGRCLYARLRNTPTAARYRAEVARILGMVRMRRLADYF